MRYLSFCLVALTSLFFMSTSIKTKTPSIGYYPGERIPNIVLSGLDGRRLDLSDYRGKKVMLTFWAAYDAQSRATNVRLYNYLKKNHADVAILSISFDKSQNVFEKTVLLDEIDLISQYCDAAGTDSEIYKDFQLNKGFKNYLINENGVIAAMDVTPEKLEKLL